MNSTSHYADITTTLVNSSPIKPTKNLPGDLAMWFFILAELTVFAIFFIGFAISEQQEPHLFSQGKEQLHQIAGLINTIALITSSFFVALALNAIHKNEGSKAGYLLIAAKSVALIYVAVKIWEYTFLFSKGLDIETNTFYTLYFMITMFHLMHVLLGMCILVCMAKKSFVGGYTNESIAGFESGAAYWHMVDLLWIILFPLIYVI